MVAFSAAVSSNYLTITARHLIQTLPTLEKKKMKHRKNEGRERREERVEEWRERREGVRERENSFPASASECLEPQCKC